MDCSTPGLPVHWQLLEFTQTHVHWVGDAIQPSHPLSSPSPPTFNLSQHQGLFKWVSSLHHVAKVLELQIQHQSSNEYSGLISFRMDWLDLPVVQGTLKSLLQHHSSKASFFWCLAFFIVQLSHPYMTTGKTIALTRRIFVGKENQLLTHHDKCQDCGCFPMRMHRCSHARTHTHIDTHIYTHTHTVCVWGSIKNKTATSV